MVQKSRSMAIEYTVDSLIGAITPLRQAIEADPSYAAAHATLASVLVEGLINGLGQNPLEDEDLARTAAAKAMTLAPRDPFILKMVGLVWAYFGDHRKSTACLRKAVEIAPFDFGAWGYLGWPLTSSGDRDDLDEARRILDRLLRKESKHPGVPFWLYHRSVAEVCSGDAESSRRSIEESLELQSTFALGWMHYANTLGLLQHEAEARREIRHCLTINPAMTPAHFRSLIAKLSGSNEAVIEARTGGLPE
jgi:tetratricopeptide (TPR) repeat protein